MNVSAEIIKIDPTTGALSKVTEANMEGVPFALLPATGDLIQFGPSISQAKSYKVSTRFVNYSDAGVRIAILVQDPAGLPDTQVGDK